MYKHYQKQINKNLYNLQLITESVILCLNLHLFNNLSDYIKVETLTRLLVAWAI